MKQSRSELKEYIMRAKEEVKQWPDWKHKHAALALNIRENNEYPEKEKITKFQKNR